MRYGNVMNSKQTSRKNGVAFLDRKPDRATWLKGGAAVCQPSANVVPDKIWRIVLLGAPGIGKGTQADLLCERLGACLNQNIRGAFEQGGFVCPGGGRAGWKTLLEILKSVFIRLSPVPNTPPAGRIGPVLGGRDGC